MLIAAPWAAGCPAYLEGAMRGQINFLRMLWKCNSMCKEGAMRVWWFAVINFRVVDDSPTIQKKLAEQAGRAIKRLRDSLGESAEAPVFIETLARRGYRFIAPVNGSSPSSGTEITPLPERSKSLFLTQPIAIGCLALIIIASLVWMVWRLPPRHTDIIERKLTSNSSENSVSSAAVSPDGKYLAYADNTGVYLKQIRTGETHPLALPPNFSVRVDDWCPDGSRLLVSRRDDLGKGSLWSVSMFGGSPRPLASDASRGAVSPDGAHRVRPMM
jgi:hypothetical protein